MFHIESKDLSDSTILLNINECFAHNAIQTIIMGNNNNSFNDDGNFFLYSREILKYNSQKDRKFGIYTTCTFSQWQFKFNSSLIQLVFYEILILININIYIYQSSLNY